jgi:PAS domain S-box-containing protein
MELEKSVPKKRPSYPSAGRQLFGLAFTGATIVVMDRALANNPHFRYFATILLLVNLLVAYWSGLRTGIIALTGIFLYFMVITSLPGTIFEYSPRVRTGLITASIVFLVLVLAVGAFQGKLRAARTKAFDAQEQALAEAEQRRETEGVLRSNEEWQRLIVESSLDAIIAIDGEGKITLWNSTAESTFGWSRDEVMGKQLSDFVVPPSYRKAHAKGMARFLETGEAKICGKTLEMTGLNKAGKEFPIELSVNSHTSAQGDLFIGFVRDISGRKQADEMRTKLAAMAELEKRNEELASFSSTVAHDLRNPLSAIDGFTWILSEGYGHILDERGNLALQRVQIAARKMRNLIEDLLKLARATEGDIRLEPVNLSDLAGSIASDLQTREPNRIVKVAIEPGLVAVADQRMISIALDNLMSNAWKFTGNEPDAQVWVGRDSKDPRHPFYVKDNGAGFPPDQAEKLFKPFERLHSESEFTGTGIGLATVKRIFERHGGEVWAHSEPEQGACFYLSLPE